MYASALPLVAGDNRPRGYIEARIGYAASVDCFYGYCPRVPLAIAAGTEVRMSPGIALRSELEFSWAESRGNYGATSINSPSGGWQFRSLESTRTARTYMSNFYIDFFNNFWASPYLSVGAGIMDFQMNSFNFPDGNFGAEAIYSEAAERAFAYSGGIGATFDTRFESLKFTLGARHTMTRFAGANFEMTQILGGLRLVF